MKFRTKSIPFLVILLLTMFVSTSMATERIIGYCSEDTTGHYPTGVKNQVAYIGATVKFPASMMQAFKGNKLTKIRIAVGEGLTTTRVIIRVGAITARPVVNQLAGTVLRGWNEITLDTPYEIDGSDIYVGYSGNQPYNKKCIWFDGGKDVEDAMWVHDGSSWDNYNGKGWGALMIQAVVSGDNFADADISVSKIKLDKTYYKAGETAIAEFTFENLGKVDFSNVGYSYQIDGGKTIEATNTLNIASGESQKVSQSIDLTGIDEGIHSLKVALALPEGAADEVADNDTLTCQLPVYENEYAKKVLLEHFTTLACINCPYGDQVLQYANSGRDDVVWVSHHAGYRTDELTISESQTYLDFGVTGAPMAMLDRTFIPLAYGSDVDSYPPFQIGYQSSAMGGKMVGSFMDYCAAVKAFASVSASNTYDETSRQLTVTVNGECNGIYQSLIPNSKLTIFLTENNVTTKHIQTGTSNGYTHQHVIRQVLTETYGDDITWNGNNFEATKTVTIPDTWKPADLNVVAFISKPFNANNASDSEVQNVCVSPVQAPAGINGVEAGEVTGKAHYFTVDGRRVESMESGVYIVKKGNKTYKVAR